MNYLYTKLRESLFILSLPLFFLVACSDEVFQELPNDPIDDNVQSSVNSDIANTIISQVGQTVNVSITGQVVDEDGNSIESAEVTMGKQTATTDEEGYFLIQGVTNSYLTYIKAIASGYFLGATSFHSEEGRSYQVLIVLVKNDKSSLISNSEGGEIRIDEKVELNFPPNGVVKQDGSSYNGQIKVDARYIDYGSSTVGNLALGRFEGITRDSLLRALQLYSMATVELKGENEEKLQVKEGEKIKIILPAPEGSPEEASLWYFNESVGIWIEDGSAVKVNGKYVGYVTHFTTWAVSRTWSDIWKVAFQIKDKYDNNLSGIKATMHNGYTFFKAYTNDLGILDMKMIPLSESVTVTFTDPTTGETVKGTATVANADETVVIRMQLRDIVTIESDTIKCNGVALKNKTFFIRYYEVSNPSNIFIATGETNDYGIIKLSISVKGNSSYEGKLSDIDGWTPSISFKGSDRKVTLTPPLDICTSPNGPVIILFDNSSRFPIDHAVEVDPNDTLYWLANSSSPVTYDLYLYTDINNPPTTPTAKGLQYPFYTQYPNKPETKYYWYVKAMAGNVEEISTVHSFTTKKTEAVRSGVLNINSQKEVNEMAYDTFHNITRLEISGEDITDLTPIKRARGLDVVGNLILSENTKLHTLKGLENIRTVTNLYIGKNNLITSLQGLEGISVLDSLYIGSHDELLSMKGLDNLTEIKGNLYIMSNPKLLSLDGLDNLLRVRGYVFIQWNTALDSFCGIKKLIDSKNYMYEVILGNKAFLDVRESVSCP